MTQPAAIPIRLKKHSLGKTFEPEQFERDLYDFWYDSGCFDAQDECVSGQKSFCMVIPPPNVTGVLHMGHALTNTIEDALVRWRRMCGDNTLWMPGTDHAGIATQAQVERAIAKEGKSASGKPLTRHDLGREAFLKRTWQWKEEHHHVITGQLKRLGCSLDWKRERFTMDEGFSKAVVEVFVRLHEQGLIYRGERIINWCCRCQTALSDLEVIPTDRKGSLWHIRYSIVEKDGRPVQDPTGTGPASVVIATTRPETLLGDTAVAVHPADERYKHLHGKFAKLPLVGRLIPVIADDYVDREFGSGALKVTPAHDFNDNDLGKRHALAVVSVIGKDGKITGNEVDVGAYAGLKFSEAREKIVQDLDAAGLLVKVEPHGLKLGLCQRCDSVAEPILSEQWFVKIEPLAKPAIEAVETGRIAFSPKNWEKTYFEWMRNIRDWCISRQLWWGHQIPAWHCAKCAHVTVAREAPGACAKCGANGASLKQDEDVLDTWFSSALWPFATLGWPEKTAALRTFYPNAILETGFDIIFFWVSRMIMMGMHFMGEVPFGKVYLHAMVRDEKGEKMSKSKGNVIDPLVVMDQHGADALRFTFATMAGQGRDIKLSTDRVEGYRAFGNKLWNATRFFLMQWEAGSAVPPSDLRSWITNPKNRVDFHPINRWILSELQKLSASVNHGLENFELNTSAQALYDFTWREFCDWYIELAKLPLKQGAEGESRHRNETLWTMHFVLEQLLALMHPFMPFLTEQLWQALPLKKPANTPGRAKAGAPPVETLMFQEFPRPNPAFSDVEAVKAVAALKSVVDAIRTFRGENNISPKSSFKVTYATQVPAADSFVRMNHEEIVTLARIESLTRAQSDGLSETEVVIPLSHPPLDLRIDIKGLVDVDGERRRLQKEVDSIQSDLAHVRKKLSNESFTARAPAELVAQEKAKEKEYLSKLGSVQEALRRLEALSR